MRLPAFYLWVPDAAFLDTRLAANLSFLPASALDSIATFTIQWSASTPPVASPPTSGALPHLGIIDWSVSHLYSDTGVQIVRAVLTTRSGDRFEKLDTTRVRIRR